LRHDGIVCSNAVGVTPAFEALLEDEIAISVIGNHDILVARAGLDGEPTRVVRVELTDGVDMYVDLIGWECQWLGGNSGSERSLVGGEGLGFGGSNIPALGEMTHDGLISIRAVSCSIGVV
jgi:hypothetical protein